MARLDTGLLLLLTLAGAAVGLLSVAYVNQHFWGLALPVAAIVAGLLNAVLLWLAAGCSAGPARFAPLLAWLAVAILAALPGPGGNLALAADWRSLLLVILGAGMPLLLNRSGTADQVRGHG